VFGLGWMELLLILIIVLVIFGAGKLPQLGEGIGKAVKGFKKSIEPEPQQIAEPQNTPQAGEAAPLPPIPPAGEHPQSARL
jgi:sec-independent protein translocase protein TatA